jgi:hypothetical protein
MSDKLCHCARAISDSEWATKSADVDAVRVSSSYSLASLGGRCDAIEWPSNTRREQDWGRIDYTGQAQLPKLEASLHCLCSLSQGDEQMGARMCKAVKC